MTVAGRERGRRARGDGPVRGRPGAAAVAAADDGAVLDVHCGRIPGAPGRGVRRLPGGRRRPGGVRGEAHGLARGGAGRAARRRPGVASTPVPGGRSSGRRAQRGAAGPACARAVGAAGLFDELDTDWLLLDTELLPWSAKATGLIREQYAGVGAAGRAALPAGAGRARRGRRRAGCDVADAARTGMADRRPTPSAFTAAYRPLLLADRGARGVRAGAVRGAGRGGRHLRRAGPRLAPRPGRPAGRRRPGAVHADPAGWWST